MGDAFGVGIDVLYHTSMFHPAGLNRCQVGKTLYIPGKQPGDRNCYASRVSTKKRGVKVRSQRDQM